MPNIALHRLKIIFVCLIISLCFVTYINILLNNDTTRKTQGDQWLYEKNVDNEQEDQTIPRRIVDYHLKIYQCTTNATQNITEAVLVGLRLQVKDALSFPKMEWMANYKNPCQRDVYPPLRDDDLGVNKGSACHMFPEAKNFKPISCMPYVYLAGMQKSGTSDIYHGLISHPHVHSSKKEVDFWSKRVLGERLNYNICSWREYLQIFKEPSKCIQAITVNGSFHPSVTIDAGPSTFWDISRWPLYPGNERAMEPLVTVAHLIHSITPQARIIATFRNPTERLYSHFLFKCQSLIGKYSCTKGEFHRRVTQLIKFFTDCTEIRSLRECVYDSCIHRGDREVVFLRVGLYHVYVEDWLNVFTREQMFFVPFETYITNTTIMLNSIFKFIGLDPMTFDEESKREPVNARTKKFVEHGDMLPVTRAALDKFYAPYNRRLSILLDDNRFLWS